MWEELDLSLRDGSMMLFSRIVVWLIFWMSALTLYRIIFVDLTAGQIFLDTVGVFSWLFMIYVGSIHAPSRFTVEIAAYIFSILKNNKPAVECFIPQIEKTEEDEEKRIYRFRW